MDISKSRKRPVRKEGEALRSRITDEELETMMTWLYAIHAYGWGKCV